MPHKHTPPCQAAQRSRAQREFAANGPQLHPTAAGTPAAPLPRAPPLHPVAAAPPGRPPHPARRSPPTRLIVIRRPSCLLRLAARGGFDSGPCCCFALLRPLDLQQQRFSPGGEALGLPKKLLTGQQG